MTNSFEDAANAYRDYQSGSATAPVGFEFITLAELYEEPDPEFKPVVMDLLPAGGSSIIAAQPKVGKTTLVRQLAICVATGSPFLGREVRQGPVLYLAFEELKHEMKKSFLVTGAAPTLPITLHFGPPPANQLQRLKEAIETLKPSLVVIDTLGNWIGKIDINSYDEAGAEIKPIHQLAREMKSAHIMIVHHAGKNQQEGVSSPLGSIALSANVDTIISMSTGNTFNAGSDLRVIETRQRYGVAFNKTALRFDPARAWYEVDEKVSLTKRRELDEGIRVTLGTNTLTQVALRDALRCKMQNLTEALERMVTDGVLIVEGTGQRGNPLRYRVSPDHAFSSVESEDDYAF